MQLQMAQNLLRLYHKLHPTPTTSTNPNANFIGRYNYYQNPYAGMPSGGGTLHLTESQIEQQNWVEKLFAWWNI